MSFRAPVAAPKTNDGYEVVTLKMLEPFAVVRYMFCEAGLQISRDRIKEFWSHHRTVGSPWALASDATHEHVPLGLFGDACKVRQMSYNPPEKWLGIFLNCPLWRPTSCRATRWLIFAIREDHLYKHETLNEVYRRVVWSLNLLHDGLYPHSGPQNEGLTEAQKARAGTPICNGMRFSVTEFRADWLYHKQSLRLVSSWKAGSRAPVCFLCPSYLRGTDRYTDLESRTSALWCKSYNLNRFLVEQLETHGGASH